MTDLDQRATELARRLATEPVRQPQTKNDLIDRMNTLRRIAKDSIALIREQAAEIERLRAENFTLAAGVCPMGFGDEGGTPRCCAEKEIERLRTRVAELERESMKIPDSDVGWDDDRVDVVGQNGNDGLHYVEAEAGPTPLRGRITDRSRD